MKMIKEKINEENIRLDIYITKLIPNYSRNQVKELFNNGYVLINNKVVKPSYLTKLDDSLEIKELLKERVIKPKNLNLEIIYEDSEILIINKPKGLLTHPVSSSDEVSVLNHLLYYSNSLSTIGGEEKDGIVHRLDKDTSGLLIVAKTNDAHKNIADQFKNREIIKLYETIVHHNFHEEKGTISAPILRDPQTKVKMVVSKLGKEALTNFKVLKQTENYSYLEVDLVTGRTHQIRVHLEFINHPLVGDQTYGIKDNFKNSFYLHAKYLKFSHPKTNQVLEFKASLPKEFENELKSIFK